MKKPIVITVLILAIISSAMLVKHFKANKESIKIDYGTSETYTKGDIDEAVSVINNKCNNKKYVIKLRYAGDEESKAMLDFSNEKNPTKYDEGIYFICKVCYKDCVFESGWFLARNQGGKWHRVFSPW